MISFFKKHIVTGAALCIAVSAMSPAAVQAEGESSEYDDEIVTFIVQTEYTPAAIVRANRKSSGAKGVRGGDPSTELEKKNENILEQAAKELDVDTSDSIIYTEADSGFTITCRRGDMEKLLAMDGVINVEEDTVFYAVPDDEEPEGDEVLSFAATEAEYKGQGTLIAIIDSGFDLDHPYFAAAPSEAKLSAEAASDKIDSLGHGKYLSQKIPFTYDYYSETDADEKIEDDPEHGTHVAGIAAGKNGTFTANVGAVTINGAAPEAQLALMAASSGPNDGSFKWIVVKKAIDDAVALGADVINMSLGSPYVDVRAYNGSSSNSTILTSIATARAAGIAVCVSQGNNGIGFYNQAPSVKNIDYCAGGMMSKYTDTFSVASVDAEVYYENITKLVTGDGLEIGANTYADRYTKKKFAEVVTSATEYVDCGLGRETDFSGKDLDGKIALIQRGGISFSEKTTNAKNAGAIAAIIYNNEDGAYLNMGYCVLPSVSITKADGERLAAAATKTVYIKGTMPVKITDAITANKPSSFTSWGFSETMQLTPNISAYGGNIYSAAPGGGYQNMSGTSMSSPYIAGASACVKSYLNTRTLGNTNHADLIQQLLMSTAVPLRYSENDSLIYSPRVQGAGMVSVDNAIAAPVVLYNSDNKTLINLGDNIDSSFTLSFTAQNLSDKDVTFNTVSVEVTTDGASEGKVNGTRKLSATSSVSSVTVPANGTADISIPVTLNGSELAEIAETFTNGFYIDGFVRLSNNDYYAGLPFSGFRGTWRNIPIWDRTIYDDGGSELIYKSDKINLDGTYLITEYLNASGKSTAVKFGGSGTKHTIISPANGDGYYDTLAAVFAPRRSLAGVTLRLMQDGAAKVSRAVSVRQHKYGQYTYSLTNTDALTNKLKALPDGDYTFRMAGKFNDGSNESTQNLYFPITVTIDNTAPVIKSVELEGTSLRATVEDANYIRSITVEYTDADGSKQSKTETFDCTGTSETAEVDFADADIRDLSVTAVDYAYNSGGISYDTVMAARTGDITSTMFRKAIAASEDITYTTVNGTITSEGITKSFKGALGSGVTGDAVIGIIVEGLYDPSANLEITVE